MSRLLGMADAYSVLGVPRSCDEDRLRTTYRELAKQFHPDVCHDDAGVERFYEIADAYRVLAHPSRRAQLDRELLQLDRFLARRPGPRAQRRRGKDAAVRIRARLDAAADAAGGVHNLVARLYAECDACLGEGVPQGSRPVPCELCAATGHVAHVQHTFDGFVRTWRPCLRCAGEGSLIMRPCLVCAGYGRVKIERSLAVGLPTQLEPGDIFVLENQGHRGERGGRPGDLYLQVV